MANLTLAEWGMIVCASFLEQEEGKKEVANFTNVVRRTAGACGVSNSTVTRGRCFSKSAGKYYVGSSPADLEPGEARIKRVLARDDL